MQLHHSPFLYIEGALGYYSAVYDIYRVLYNDDFYVVKQVRCDEYS